MRSATAEKDVTVAVAARRLNVAPRTVYRMISRRELIRGRDSRPHRGMTVTIESVDAWLARMNGSKR